MNPSSRRRFVLHAVATTGLLGAGHARVLAADLPKVEESDAQATALGYRHDTAMVDAKKYPKHSAEQRCGTCQLFQGKAGEDWGGCALFGGKLGAEKGWCTAWVKKA